MPPKGPVRPKQPLPSAPFLRWIETRMAFYETAYERPPALMRGTRSPGGYLPLRPVQHLTQEIGWGISESAERKLRRIRNGQTQGGLPTSLLERQLVEDALNRAGVLIEDVYPELAEDVPLEPDEFCIPCWDWSTPINGVCPWCETTLEEAA